MLGAVYPGQIYPGQAYPVYGVIPPVIVPGDGRKRHIKPITRWDHEREDEEDMKLSILLAKQLAEVMKVNQALMNSIKPPDQLATPQLPQELLLSPLEKQKRQEWRDKMMAAKEAKRIKEEEQRREMLKRMAKARRAKKRKNG